MLKYIVTAFALIAAPALAQQPDPAVVIATYKMLLSEANDRIAAMNAQSNALQKELELSKSELSKAKGEQKPEQKK